MSPVQDLQSCLLSRFSLQAKNKANPGDTVMTCYPQATELTSQLWQMQKHHVLRCTAKKGEDEQL